MTGVALVRAYRTAIGLLAFSALVTEVATLHERGRLDVVNFVSYFTVESNLLAAVAFVGGGIALTGRGEGEAAAMLRGAARSTWRSPASCSRCSWRASRAWSSRPCRGTTSSCTTSCRCWSCSTGPSPRLAARISFRRGLIGGLALPLAYVVYSLVRGHSTGWYPYPFLDPARAGTRA